MYDSNNLICKEIIDANWLEFLKAVKKQRIEQNKVNAAQAAERLKNYVSNGNMTSSAGLVQTSCESPVDVSYLYIGVESFWQWYMDNKIEV